MGHPIQCASCGQLFRAGAVVPLSYQSGVSDKPPRFNYPAIASVVCGLLFFMPLLPSLLAILFGIMGLNRAKDPRVGGKRLSIAGIILGLIGLLIMGIVLTANLTEAREAANRMKCANNMIQIGKAILFYANDNHGYCPPDLPTLIASQSLAPALFVCPDDKVKPPPANLTAQQAAAWVNANSSYLYVGAGVRMGDHPSRILLYEKDQNHGEGMNILFINGNVDWFDIQRARALIQQAATRPGG